MLEGPGCSSREGGRRAVCEVTKFYDLEPVVPVSWPEAFIRPCWLKNESEMRSGSGKGM